MQTFVHRVGFTVRCSVLNSLVNHEMKYIVIYIQWGDFKRTVCNYL